jgi:DNA-binding CsgD family transcriptional regulator
MSTAQIARRLFISEVTVRSHIAAVLHKLGVPNRASALRLLEEH